jgi:serine protease Do
MSTTNTPTAFSDDLATLAARIRESVVQVHAGQRGIGSGVIWPSPAPLSPQGEGLGVRSPDAVTIITNAHVVHAVGNADLTVKHADGRHLKAELFAVDPQHDLAALRVSAEDLRPIEVGDSSALRVGELVLAVGNPFGHEGAVTVGVVAARAPADPDVSVEPAESPDQHSERTRGGRGWPRFREMDLIQADLRLYPGNSGGPLTDSHGRLVGINAMIGGGLAYSIPSRTVQAFLADAGHTSTPLYLGIEVLTAPLPEALRQRHALAQETAVLIAGVESGGAAEAAGLLVGDVLLAVDDVAVADARLLPRVLRRVSADHPRTLALLRGGERVTITLTLQGSANASAAA